MVSQQHFVQHYIILTSDIWFHNNTSYSTTSYWHQIYGFTTTLCTTLHHTGIRYMVSQQHFVQHYIVLASDIWFHNNTSYNTTSYWHQIYSFTTTLRTALHHTGIRYMVSQQHFVQHYIILASDIWFITTLHTTLHHTGIRYMVSQQHFVQHYIILASDIWFITTLHTTLHHTGIRYMVHNNSLMVVVIVVRYFNVHIQNKLL